MPASEIMAILCLATRPAGPRGAPRPDHRRRHPRTGSRSAPRDLKASGAMALLLKDAICPTSCRRSRAAPALVHGGPFGNIAHGCNSLVATRLGLALGDVVLTEAGFGSDLGAEKFFDIKCRFGGLKPEAAVLVATVRALKMHGGAKKDALGTPDLAALERGLANLEQHVRNVQQFGVPVVVALNRFLADTRRGAGDGARLRRAAGAPARRCRGLGEGRRRRRRVAAKCSRCSTRARRDFRPLYDVGAARSSRRSRRSPRSLRRRRRRLHAARPRRRSPMRGDGPGRHAGVHGQDAVLAHRRSDQARPADRLPHHRQRRLRRPPAPASSWRWPATS